jgi:flagellar hook-associated protein 2
MTDRQVEEWEAIARKGILRNDAALERLARDLRGSFFAEIEGLGMRPSDLGLSTGNFFDRTGGQIFINEDRLRAALEEDPDRVMSVFTRQGSTNAEQGLVTRINRIVGDFVSFAGPSNTATRNLERSIRSVNDQIDRMTERMWAEEDRLYRQFAAMERAMSQLQSQGDWMSAMLGGM